MAEKTYKRIHNFSAGPGVMPESVLLQAQAEMLDFHGSGMSIMEMSHSGKIYEAVIKQTEMDLRKVLQIPDTYKVLFQQGGATMQFAMVPMNLRPAGASADYIVNGSWGQAAIKDAKKLGATKVVATSQETNFDRFPALDPAALDPKAAYLHFTSNETIHGVESVTEPVTLPGVPLVCDMSSDFMARPVDISKYGLVFAGAQKNAGPAGVTIVIIREDLLERVPAGLPFMLDYKVQAEKESMHNTPPTYSIYLVGLVLKWLLDLGGVPAIYKRNVEKARLVYDVIDQSGGFYRGHAVPSDRSLMNVTFRLPSEDLENQFAKEAAAVELSGLKGHRSVGGMRASIYNACPVESVKALADFMQEFQRKNG